MGFWARDRMDLLGLPEPILPELPQSRPEFPCMHCGLVFESQAELAVHRFYGHFSERPIILVRGREVGTSRLIVTTVTDPEDWVFHKIDIVELNGELLPPEHASALLARRPTGVVDIIARGSGHERFAQVEFALPTEHDLDGVDAALQHLVSGHELSRRAIVDFVERGRSNKTAARYLDGLASYLFGVLARENLADAEPSNTDALAEQYTARYDTAVTELGRYDRPAAETICALVAFHYNQFDQAMRRTRSPLVSAVALRMQKLLASATDVDLGDLTQLGLAGLELALSDSATERVLLASAATIEGSWDAHVEADFAALGGERPYDELKLRVVAAEHYLAVEDHAAARAAAEPLRHERKTEDWYMQFRKRMDAQL
ncbi:hypothetical protein ACFFGH_28375 [Lysobacter korlensis]|uniref:C2H2-type domain-containing protein n=1 Tax=Lysobacter korlensis TaxID=553636 RepID=A0ABV6RYA0_9GAMM